MNPPTVRRALHVGHSVTVLVLVATGLLIQWPDLRARLIGGYGLQIASLHNWVGVGFIAAPVLALALSARPLVGDLLRRLGPPDPVGWRKIHIVTSLLVSLLLVLSGLYLWVDPDLPLAWFDLSVEIHVALTWVLGVLIPLHLVAARRKIAAAVRRMIGSETEPDLGFPLDEEEDA
jgi:cytochrome b subunit of formate dehydrogenase